MKSKQLCPSLHVTIACVVVLMFGFLAPQAESATNKTIDVGDNAGWTNSANFDYQAFISNYTIDVHDRLVFTNVDSINHTVIFLANKAAYDACDVSNQTFVDGVVLEPQYYFTWMCTVPATYYIVCGIPGHCTTGNQKLYFTCHTASGTGGAPAPAAFAPAPVIIPPTPTSAPPSATPTTSPPAAPPVTTTTLPPSANPPTTPQNPVTPPPPPPKTTLPSRPGAAAGLNTVGLPTLALLVAACYFGSTAIPAGL